MPTTPSDGGQARRWLTPRILVLLFLASLPAVTPRIYASDEVQYFSYLRSLWFDHDLDFENEYQYFYAHGVSASPEFHETFLERTTEAGRRINFGTIGCALLWAPFYATGDLVAHVMRAAGSAVEIDGYSRPYVAAVAYGSACYGLLALLLAVATVDRLGRLWPTLPRFGTLAALAVWIGTPLVFYMYVAPPMSHATSAFAVSLFLWWWIRIRDTWRPAEVAVLGVFAAVMAMVREQDAFFAVGPALDFIWTAIAARDGRTGRWAAAGAAGIGAGLVAFLPQALAYLALNGHVGPSHLVARKMSWSAPHALQVLASPAHGFLVWTPLAAAGLAGLVALLRRLPAEARPIAAALLLVSLLQVYVAGSVESWTVAGAFGQRRFVSLTAPLVVGIAALLAVTPSPAWRRITGVLLGVAVWWNVALAVQFGAGLMDRQRLEPARIAYNTFVVVPRALPGLAWRYVFDRASFYESARALGGR
jgi:hypothetical protein